MGRLLATAGLLRILVQFGELLLPAVALLAVGVRMLLALDAIVIAYQSASGPSTRGATLTLRPC
jgi:hypothetical protein